MSLVTAPVTAYFFVNEHYTLISFKLEKMPLYRTNPLNIIFYQTIISPVKTRN